MICHHANDFIFRAKQLDDKYSNFKKYSCGQKTLNFAFFLIKKRYMTGKIILILINIIMVMLGLLLVLLNIIFILLQS